VSARIEELTDEQRSWIGAMVDFLRGLGIADDALALSTFFDEHRAAWEASPVAERKDPGSRIALVGAGVGHLLVTHLGMRWVQVTDQYGTEIGLAVGPTDQTVFPMSAVAQRWNRAEQSSIAEFLTEVATRAEALERPHRPARGRRRELTAR
jgi:hypothetical protein